MKILKLFIPFILVYLAMNYLLTGLSLVAGEKYADYNVPLEGARILRAKDRILKEGLPRKYNILFAGTSRTLAAVSASTVAQEISSALGSSADITAYNLGNIGYNLDTIEEIVTGGKAPDVLVLEIGAGLSGARGSSMQTNYYERYQGSKSIWEQYASGVLKEVTFGRTTPKLCEASVSASMDAFVKRTIPLEKYYYYSMCCANGSGAVAQPDGQTTFNEFIPDRERAQYCKDYYNERTSFIPMAKKPIAPEAWEVFQGIVRKYGAANRLVIYNPPVDPARYELDQRSAENRMRYITEYLSREGVPYLDFNPNKYFFTDYHHMDWFDTEAFSQEFAGELLRLIDWSQIEKK